MLFRSRVIGFELGGRVLEVSVARGQEVALGAKLARLDDGLERPLRALRIAEISAAEAQLAELAPHVVHPHLGQTVSALLANVKDDKRVTLLPRA